MVIFDKIAEYIVDYLLQQGIIEKEQEEIYIYGFYRVLIDGVNIISIFLISLWLGEVLEAIVFVITFRLLRSYAGGYHAKTQWGCYFLTMLTITMTLSIIKFFEVSRIVSIILWIFSGLIIFLLSPVEAENKPLDKMEISIYGKRAKIIFLVETICFLISLPCNWIIVYESILLAAVCTSLSLVMASVRKVNN